MPLRPSVRNTEPVALGIALRSTAGQRDHHRDGATVVCRVAQTIFQQSELRALSSCVRDRTRARQQRDVAVNGQRPGCDWLSFQLRDE